MLSNADETRVSWGKIATLSAIGAFVAYVVGIVFVEGRGYRLRGFRRLSIPIVDADEQTTFFTGLMLFTACLFARVGDDLWSIDAFKSTLTLTRGERTVVRRWTAVGMAIGVVLVATAIVRSN
ncbi:MAG: hypothetical protein JNL94_03600 [Planctomycetes bacterium]|nr:hypothetical protein [Planctomycetota bacterium]